MGVAMVYKRMYFTCLKIAFITLVAAEVSSCDRAKYNTTSGRVLISHETNKFDFGTEDNGDKDSIHVAIPVLNDTQNPVRINDVEASCPCISIKGYPDELGKASVDTIHLSIGIKAIEGRFSKPIFVSQNGRTALIRIVGKIK